MPSFAVRHPYFIIVFCLFVVCSGLPAWRKCPWTCFLPSIFPSCWWPRFYSGMPPEQIEADITDTFERFFTLGSGMDHMESRSMTGVSLIKIYFQPGTDANADVTQISNLAMADLRRLAAGNAAARGDESGCLQLARLLADRGWRGAGRNPAARLFAVSDSQPDRRRSRRDRSAALRRQIPADHGVRGPAETAGAPTESHGRGARDERLELDSSRRRRAHRSDGLQHLHQRAGGQTPKR